MITNKIKIIVLTFIFCLFPNVAFLAESFPSFPMAFYGEATLNGDDLPIDTKIQVVSDSQVQGEVVILESGIYGYNSPIKIKLLVNEYEGSNLVFRYILPNTSEAILGDTEIVYSDIFESGKTIEKNLNFVIHAVPVITLKGTSSVVMYQGEKYGEKGATAWDDIDGDISDDIIIAINPCGESTTNDSDSGGGSSSGGCSPVCSIASGICYYPVTYNVSNSAGKPAVEVIRTVTILPIEEGQEVLTVDTIVSTSSPEILISANAPSVSNIIVPSTVIDAQLNVSAILEGTNATFTGSLSIDSETSVGNVNVQIPVGTQVFGGVGWTGEINLPQVQANTSVNIIPDSGNTGNIDSVIEIGFGDRLLTFDKAVRILISGQASNYAGYSRSGVFYPIDTICSEDTQDAGNSLLAGSDCKMIVGDDLIIWTKHFTKYITYTQTAIQSSSSSSGGGGGTSLDYTPPAQPTSFKAERNIDSVDLTWINPIDTDFNKVLLVRGVNEINASVSGKDLESNGEKMYEGNLEEYVDLNIEEDVYYYAITAYDNKNNYSIPLVIKNSSSTEELDVLLGAEVADEILVLAADYDISTDVELIIQDTIRKEEEAMSEIDVDLSKRVSGRILLQIEEHGEAWYVNPIDNKKYYMANGDKAYSIMRFLSVGITNKDLERVMIDKDFAKKHSGKIFLQVEEHGEAYYIDVDGNAHYLKDGSEAYVMMRNLGLGITNTDIRKISIGEVN